MNDNILEMTLSSFDSHLNFKPFIEGKTTRYKHLIIIFTI